MLLTKNTRRPSSLLRHKPAPPVPTRQQVLRLALNRRPRWFARYQNDISRAAAALAWRSAPCTKLPIDSQAKFDQACDMPAPGRDGRALNSRTFHGVRFATAAKGRGCPGHAPQQDEICLARCVTDRECRLHLVIGFDGVAKQLSEDRMPLGHVADCGVRR